MHTYRLYFIITLLIVGLIGCQKRMTVIKARLVERGYSETPRETAAPPADRAAVKQYSNGLALLAAGDTSGAIQKFAVSLETDSSLWTAHYMLGLLEPTVSEDGCLRHFRSALQFAPPVDSIRSQIYAAMGICYEGQAALAFAEQNYWTALQLNPESEIAEAGLKRVRILRQTGE